MIGDARTDDVKVNLSMEVNGLAKYWHYYHPLQGNDITRLVSKQLIKLDRPAVETLTGLSLFKSTKIDKFVHVADMQDGIAPTLVLVENDGSFTAIYDDQEVELITNDPNCLVAENKLYFGDYKTYIPVWERISLKPTSLVVRDRKPKFYSRMDSIAPDLQRDMSKNATYFPCEVFTVWKDQPTLPGLTGGYTTTFVTPPKLQKSMCGFDSTEDYLDNILGIGLDSSDQNWYSDDERVIGPGLPLEHTLTVLSELVEPYNVEIDKVWLSEHTWSDEIAEFSSKIWMDDDFYREMKADNPKMPEPRMFRVDELPNNTALVVMARSASPFPSGHAQYVPPRRWRPKEWAMALTFRRK